MSDPFGLILNKMLSIKLNVWRPMHSLVRVVKEMRSGIKNAVISIAEGVKDSVREVVPVIATLLPITLK